MHRTMNQENLVFLISQPRAGSTLLQSILGSLPEVHTTSEPWFMLPFLCPLSKEGEDRSQSGFDSQWGRQALRAFLSEIPDGEEEYLQQVQQLCLHRYAAMTNKAGKKFFLDKTPRYYLIIPELFRTFPQAKFIILLRNPLAALCSMQRTWAKDNIWNLQTYRSDILHAPSLLAQGIDVLGKNAHVLQYEQLVLDPEKEIQNICTFIGCTYETDALQYTHFDWFSGDKDNLHAQRSADSHGADKWLADIDDPQLLRLTRDYLECLDGDVLKTMGYSKSTLQSTVYSASKGITSAETHTLQEVLTDTPQLLTQHKLLLEKHRQQGREHEKLLTYVQESNRFRKTYSYRIGRMCTAIPRVLMRCIRICKKGFTR